MPTYNLLTTPLKDLQWMVYDAIHTDDSVLREELLYQIYVGLNGKINNIDTDPFVVHPEKLHGRK